MQKRLLLNFDFDGVLVDSFDQLFRLVNETYHETGIGRPPELSDFSEAEELRFSSLANLSDVSMELRQEFAEYFYCKQNADDSVSVLFAGISSMLSELSEHHVLTVVSASREGVIRNVLNDRGIEHHFDVIHGGDKQRSKSEQLTSLVEYYNADPGDTFMIGDAISDITHGKGAGVRTVAVTWGFQSPEFLQRVEPDFMVSSPGELSRLFYELTH